MSIYVKGLDPNHLVMVGSWGYFGASTPALLPENPSGENLSHLQNTLCIEGEG
jgi:endo-1,4-beta-mannosidase